MRIKSKRQVSDSMYFIMEFIMLIGQKLKKMVSLKNIEKIGFWNSVETIKFHHIFFIERVFICYAEYSFTNGIVTIK